MPERCPLCRETTSSPISTTSYERIFAEHAKQWGASFPPDVRDAHTPAETTTLVACAGCGLEYFNDAVAGDERFYEQVTGAAGYEAQRWEFDEIGARLSGQDAVVDFGAGSGEFLLQIQRRVGRAVGVDHNTSAVDELRRKGLEGSDEGFETFAHEHPDEFDVATAFHVIEHVPDVEVLVAPALRCLRPGGRLFVSAPNADRVRLDEQLEPKDFPPHHLSRWRDEQWTVLAERFDLDLVSVDHEPPPIIAYEHFVADRVARLSRRLSRPVLSAMWRSGLTQRLYGRKVESGWFAERGLYGHSMLAEFRSRR